MWVKTLYPQWTSRLMVIPYTSWLVGFDPYPYIYTHCLQGFPSPTRYSPQLRRITCHHQFSIHLWGWFHRFTGSSAELCRKRNGMELGKQYLDDYIDYIDYSILIMSIIVTLILVLSLLSLYIIIQKNTWRWMCRGIIPKWLYFSAICRVSKSLYPLVNIQKTIENHHF